MSEPNQKPKRPRFIPLTASRLIGKRLFTLTKMEHEAYYRHYRNGILTRNEHDLICYQSKITKTTSPF